MKKLLNKVILIVALSIYIFANDEVLILDTSGSLSNISTVVEIKKLTERYLIEGKSIIAFNDDSYPVKSKIGRASCRERV